MKTKKKNQAAQIGCLSRLVKWLCPKLTMTRKESIDAIKSLQWKLNKSRKETEKWRKRDAWQLRIYI